MKKFVFAIMLFATVATAADAQTFRVQRNRFPIANGIGRAINRVVGFPFRVAGAALGFQPRSRVFVNRQQIVLANNGYRNQFRAAPIVIQRQQFNHVPRQRVILRQTAGYNTQQFSLRQTADYQTERIVQRVVAQPQYQTERIVERVVAAPQTERIIEREQVTDDCPQPVERTILREEAVPDHCVSQFRVQRVRASYRGY